MFIALWFPYLWIPISTQPSLRINYKQLLYMNYMKNFYTFLVGIFAFSLGFGQTLSPGDLAIIGVGVDEEEILVVALTDIPSGESVFFTDEEWGGSNFNTGEGFYEWVTPTIVAGTVVTITTANTTAGGTVTQREGSFALGNSGDGVFLYQTSTNTFNSGTYTLLGFAGEDSGDAGTLSGSGLTIGTTAIYFGGDNGIYNGTRASNDKAGHLANIYNNTNWATSGSSQTFDSTAFVLSTGGPTIGFDNPTSSENETNITFTSSNIPISVSNYDGNQIDIDINVTGGTAESGDYTFTSPTSLSFTADGTQNITIDINDDADYQDETIELTITETSAVTGLVIAQETHTVTIVDDEEAPPVTLVAFQSFEGGDSWNYTTDPATFNVSGAVWDVVNNSFNTFGTIPSDGTNFFGIQDLNSTNGTSGFGSIDFETVSVAGLSDIVVKFDYEVDGFDSDDDMKYELFEDNISQGEVVFLDGFSNLDADGTIEINVSPGTTNIRLVVSVKQNGGSDYGALDNFRVEGLYSGLTYTNGLWTPSAPDGTTGASDAIIINGVATLNSDVNLNNLVVNPGAGLEVATGTTLTVNTLALESTSTSYSSLILDGTITGTMTYNRYTNAYTNDATNNDNDLISTPLTPLNGEFFAAFATTNPNLLESGTLRAFAPFNNTTGLYENYDVVANASTSLTPGTGYRAATSDGSTLAFIGTAETGDVYKDIIVGDDPTYGEWNLIGNPYPSYIDAEAFLTHTVSTAFSGETNMDLLVNASGIYGYDGDTSDGWKVITLANDNGQLIAPGQGFFVAADADDTLFHDVEFTPAMRTTGNADDFIQGRSNTTLSFVKLRASTANHSYNTEFYFDDNASLGLDPGYDAVVWGGTAPSTFALYSHLVQNNSGMPIALQALGSADLSNVTIPLGLNANSGESLTISISEMNTPVAVNVYLEDYQNNTLTLLNDTDFVINPIDNLNGTGRFYLRLSNSVLSTTDNVFDTVSIYANQANRTINISGQLTDDTFAKVYDIQGRLVSTTALDANATRQTIDASNLNTGVYIVKLTNNNITKTEKIILK